jgi:hypothetical protein
LQSGDDERWISTYFAGEHHAGGDGYASFFEGKLIDFQSLKRQQNCNHASFLPDKRKNRVKQ